MEINFENKELLSSLYVHDSEFVGYTYNYAERALEISLENIFLNKLIHFRFENVIVVHLQSCSFWHGGNSVVWMNLIEENDYLNKLVEIQKRNVENFEGSYLDQGIHYLTIEYTINSGDTLLITCEKINYTEEKLIYR